MSYNLKMLINHSVTRVKQLSIKSKYSVNTTYFVNIPLNYYCSTSVLDYF